MKIPFQDKMNCIGFKKAGLLLLAAAEVLLLLWSGRGLFLSEQVVYTREQIEGQALRLTPGVYRVDLVYEAKGNDVNKLSVTYGGFPFGALLCNEVSLQAGAGRAESVLWVTAEVSDVSVQALNGEAVPEDFSVKALTVTRTGQGGRILFFLVVCGCLCADALVWFRYRRKKAAEAAAAVVTDDNGGQDTGGKTGAAQSAAEPERKGRAETAAAERESGAETAAAGREGRAETAAVSEREGRVQTAEVSAPESAGASAAQAEALRRRRTVWALGAIVLLASLPLLTDYLFAGHDTTFHLLRTEGLWKGWREGYFPVRIQPGWMKGHGYAVSVFYSDLFLSIPALLRLIGFPVMTSYKLFVLMVNLATAAAAYLSFKGCFRNGNTALLGAMLYTLNPYRLYDVYVRASVGEYTAMIFLPVLCYGFYRIYTRDVRQASYKRSFLPVALGLTGIIQSHVLTCEMAAVFILITAAVCWRKTFRGRTFLELCKAAGAALALNAWFLLPLGEYLAGGGFYVGNATDRLIQRYGVFPAHLAQLFYAGGGQADFEAAGMNGSGAYGIGAALMACLVVYVYLWSMRELPEKGSSLRGAGALWFSLAVSALALSLGFFPWDALQYGSGFLRGVIAMLQFPTRFLAPASVFAAFLACVTAEGLKRQGGLRLRLFVGVVGGLCLTGAFYQTAAVLNETGFYRIYTEESIGSMIVGGGEYLPETTVPEQVEYGDAGAGEGVELLALEKDRDGLRTRAECRNLSGENSYVEFPLFYYRYYEAKNEADGSLLPAGPGGNGNIRVDLPAGFDGAVTVDFVSPAHWRAAEGVSAAAALALTVWGLLRLISNRARRTGRQAGRRGLPPRVSCG